MTTEELTAFIAEQRAIDQVRTQGEWRYNESRGEFQDENADPVIFVAEAYDHRLNSFTLLSRVNVANPDTDNVFIEAVTENYGKLLDALENTLAELAALKAKIEAGRGYL